MNNPGGKLPVTMYPANFVNENDFLNMSMQASPGRSYKYYTGTPIYPFAHGVTWGCVCVWGGAHMAWLPFASVVPL